MGVMFVGSLSSLPALAAAAAAGAAADTPILLTTPENQCSFSLRLF
jgi:hypothetical protein